MTNFEYLQQCDINTFHKLIGGVMGLNVDDKQTESELLMRWLEDKSIEEE